MGRTLKDKVDDLEGTVQEELETVQKKLERIRESADGNSRALLEGIQEASDDISESIASALEEEKAALEELREEMKKIRDDKKAFAKSQNFFFQGTAMFKKGSFQKALEYFEVARRAADGVFSPVFKENGISATFNAHFMIAECYQKLGRNEDALRAYIMLRDQCGGEDRDYHSLFVSKKLIPTLRSFVRFIWDSRSEEKRKKIMNPDRLSFNVGIGKDDILIFSFEHFILYTLSLHDSEFKDLGPWFGEIRQMYDERKALLEKNQSNISAASNRIGELRRKIQELKQSLACEEGREISVNPKSFSGAGTGWLVGFIVAFVTSGFAAQAGMSSANLGFSFAMVSVWIAAGFIAAVISRNRKYQKVFDRENQVKISRIESLKSHIGSTSTEAELKSWEEHFDLLSKWQEDNRTLVVTFNS